MTEFEGQLFPLSVLRDLVDWLNDQHTPGIIIGGVAASILGRPRLTADVDVSVLVDEANWAEFLASGGKYGFVTRQPDAISFARRSRMLLMRHGSSGINVDIVFAALPFEAEAIARAQAVRLLGLDLPLPTVEDLVIMKAVAHRPRDLTDVEAIVASHPELDRRRVLHWVRQFSTALDMPDVLHDLQALLKRRRSRD